jgi:hypothetical protein
MLLPPVPLFIGVCIETKKMSALKQTCAGPADMRNALRCEEACIIHNIQEVSHGEEYEKSRS